MASLVFGGRRRAVAPLFVAVVSLIALAFAAEDAAEKEPFVWDAPVEHFLFRWIPEAHSDGNVVWRAVVLAFLALVVLVPSVLARRGRLREAAFWIVSIGALDVFGLAPLVLGADPGEYSFPSPGAMLFGALATATTLLVADVRRRYVVALVGSTIAIAHGLFVVDLGLHHPSEIFAGWLVAVAWVTSVWLKLVHVPVPGPAGTRPLSPRDGFLRLPATPSALAGTRRRRRGARPRVAESTDRPGALTGAGQEALLEPNLFLSFDALSRRLLAHLPRAIEEDRLPRDRDEAVVDGFLLAAGLNQIFEDYLHRDLLSLWSASKHLPPPLAGVARLAARVGSRVRAWGPRARRIAARQRALESLVARLAEVVAGHVLASERADQGADAPFPDRQVLELAQRALLPAKVFPPSLRAGVQRLPNCFRSFDQQPLDCLRVVERFAQRRPDRSRPLLVVGLRTSGNYLAPLHAAFLTAAGYDDVRVVTLRPGKLIGRRAARAIQAAAADGASGLLVDDPPRTGTQLAQAGAELRRRGLSDVTLLLQVPAGEDSLPETLRGYASVVLEGADWAILEGLDVAAAEEALSGLLVGRVVECPDDHARVRVAGVEVESIDVSAPRRGHVGARIVARLTQEGSGRRFRVPIYAEGVGLGYFGRHSLAIANRLSSHVAPVYGLRDGLLYRAWLPDEHRLTAESLCAPDGREAGVIAHYVADRSRLLELDTDVALELAGRDAAWEHVAQMLGDAFGRLKQFVRPLTHRTAKRLAAVPHPAVTDAVTAPWAWFSDDSGRMRKVDFQQRASSNTGFQSCDPVFDLAEAAAAAESIGANGFGERVRREYESLAGRTIDDERWLLYRLLHHLGAYRTALDEATADSERSGAAFAHVLEVERTMASIHRRYFEQRYFFDLEPLAEGPLCAIDIDGVLETRWVVFPAIAPAGALAVRALNRHGLRAVLVTGRSLEEVRARCSAYHLPGGVAEYGSVIYDHRDGSEHSLLTPNASDALGAVRRVLARFDGVHDDPGHRHSVRAHLLDAGGRRRGLPAETIDAVLRAAGVEDAVRAVPGVLQTDFVSAAVDKGRGLEALAETLGAVDDGRPLVSLAVGDSESDLPMLALAERAFAPANAAPEVRARAESAGGSYQAGLLAAVAKVLGHLPRRCAVCRPAPPPSAECRLLLAALTALDGGKRGKVGRALSLAATLAFG